MRAALAVLLVGLLVVPGCISFYGEDTIEVHVLVTEDMGTLVLTDKRVQLATGSTAMDAIRAVATVQTAYAGGFVTSIDGRQSRYPDERIDWFYHVDTELQGIGAASRQLKEGDLVLWDHRPWNRTMTLPHVLTGLPAWPGTLDLSNTTGPGELASLDGAEQRWVRTDGHRLALLDAWGTTARWIEPPWLLVHVTEAPGSPPGFLTVASDAEARALADRLPEKPTGVGVVITPEATLELPR